MNKIGTTIKRIAALAGGALMVGATIAGAFAAVNLHDLPTPFITSAGVFDGFVVVGTMGWNPDVAYNAAAVQGLAGDVAVGIDVGAAFAQKASSAAAAAGTGTSYSGGVKFETPGNKLVLTQDIQDLKATFTSSDFSWLGGGTYQDNVGKTGTYKEYLTMGDGQANVVFAKPTTGSATEPNLYLKILAYGTNYTYTYKALFDKDYVYAATTDVTSSNIKLLGEDWLIKEFGDNTISLMGGKNKYTVTTDTPVTATIDGKTYTITLQTVTATAPGAGTYRCTYDINGETVQLTTGASTKLSAANGGLTVGATVCDQAKAGVADIGTLFLGARTVKVTNAAGVEIDGTAVAGSSGICTINTTSKVMSKLGYSYGPNEETYKAANVEFLDPIFGSFSLVFTGVTPDLASTDRESIQTTLSGDKNLVATFKTLGGTVSTEVFYDTGSASGCGKWAGSTTYNRLYVNESLAYGMGGIARQDSFVATNSPYSHILQFASIDTTNRNVGFYDRATGQSTSQSYTAGTGASCPAGFASGYGTLVLDGNDFRFCVNSTTVGSEKIVFDMNGNADGTTNATYMDTGLIPMYTAKGAKIDLYCPNGTSGSVATFKVSEEKNKTSADYANSVNWTYGYTAGNTNKLEIGTVSFSDGSSAANTVGSTNTNKGMDRYGSHVTYDTSTEQATLSYPDYYTSAEVWIVPKGTTATTTTTTGAVNMHYFSGATGIAKTDAEYATPTKPVVLIGGPYVNELVKKLADAGKTTKAADFVEDTAIIQMVENAFGENEALIIAGYAAKDTALAGKVVTSYLLQGNFADKLTGDKVTIGTAGVSTVTGVTFK